MTLKKFRKATLKYVIAWYKELTRLVKADKKAQKIEPEIKRKLIATAQSLNLYIQEEFSNGSD